MLYLSRLIIPLALTLGAGAFAAAHAEARVQTVQDLRELARASERERLPILIEVAMDHCPYCARLESEFLGPMLLTGYDRDHVIIRRIDLDAAAPLTDVDGKTITAQAFADRYGVKLVPTLLLLDSQGRELAERLVGLTTPDFFGGYLEGAIHTARSRLQSRPGI